MWRHGRAQANFSEEIRAHIEMETDRLRSEGLSEAEAYAQARREFGNVTRAEERFYESNRLLLAAENVLRDVHYGVRVLRKSPAFTLVAILSLALGIGANTAVFSYFNGIVLRPLPVDHSDELIALYKDGGPQYAHNFPYPFYLQLRQRMDLFTGVLCFSADAPSRLTTQGGQVVWRVWQRRFPETISKCFKCIQRSAGSSRTPTQERPARKRMRSSAISSGGNALV